MGGEDINTEVNIDPDMGTGGVEQMPPNDLPPQPQSENPEIDSIVQDLEQYPDLINQTKKYVEGMIGSKGGAPQQNTQTPNQPQQMPESKEVPDLDSIIEEIITKKKKR